METEDEHHSMSQHYIVRNVMQLDGQKLQTNLISELTCHLDVE